MLIISCSDLGASEFADKYKDRAIYLDVAQYVGTDDWLIELMGLIKESIEEYDVVIVPFLQEVVLSLDALKIKYAIAYIGDPSPEYAIKNKDAYDFISTAQDGIDKLILDDGEPIDNALYMLVRLGTRDTT